MTNELVIIEEINSSNHGDGDRLRSNDRKKSSECSTDS